MFLYVKYIYLFFLGGKYENKFYKISYVNSDNSSDSSDSRISVARLTKMFTDKR